MGAKIHDKFILLWLLTFLSVGWSDIFDWRDHMEDAFADEGHTEGTCKRSFNDKFIFCRYQEEDNKSLSTWEPCLCTHILITAEPYTQRINIPHSLKSTDRDKKIIASISVSGDDKLNASSDFQQLLSALSDLPINGIDMRVEQSANADGASKSKMFQYIQDIVSLLRTEAKFQILSITVQRNMVPFLYDPQFLEITSYFDFLSFVPPLSLRISEIHTEEYFDALQELESLLKGGFPKSKLLIPISLRQQMRNVMKETFTHEIYPTMCRYIDTEQNKIMELPSTKNLNLVDELKNEVRNILDKDVAGADIWSINDDDEKNICGKKPFPLISEISNSIKNGKDSFDSFTDLDITLSTGESQLTEEIQVLHEQNTDPEEMRKFKCEKIGFYRHPTDCSKFYHCAEYRAATAQPESQHAVFVYKCPRGLVYDERQVSCNWPSYSEPCQGSAELMPVPPKKFKCTTPGFHVHPVDCRWFYYCSDLGNGQLAAFEFLCPSHLLGFDESNMLCNWKWMVPQCESNEQESLKPTTEQPHDAREGHPFVLIRDKIPSRLNVKKVVTDTVLPVSVGNPIEEARNIPLDVRVPSRTQETFFRRDQLSITKASSPSDTTYTSKSLERKTASFVNYTDEIPEKAEYKPENKPVIDGSDTRNSTEKKYGTAYWHRSMITNPSRVQIPPNIFDVSLENSGDPTAVSEDKSISKIPRESNSSKEHRYGIGRVRKLNVRPVRNQSVNGKLHDLNFKKEEPYISNPDVISLKDNKHFSRNDKTSRNYHSDGQSYYAENLQGRAVGENVLPNYEFEDLINRHQNSKNDYHSEVVRNQQRNLETTNNFGDEENSRKNPQSTNSYARVKCSKLTAAASNNDPKILGDNTFGCTGEVSLFVKMKEGNEFSKYVLKTGDVSNSAHQESKQHKLLVNDTDVKNNFKSQNLQLEGTDEPVSKMQNRNEDEVKSRSVYTQGRSVSRDLNFAISARSAPLMLQAIRLGDQEKDMKENPSLTNSESEKQNSEKENSLEVNNFHYSLRHEKEKEKETLTINTKAKFMPLSFYPQGVLLNVDLNHINEIPPQILLEVDIMLKKFMTNGNIDVNLLMKKLNATMEPMENVEHTDNITNDKINSMLSMFENILNSTDSKNIGTESFKNISEIPLTSDISVNSTTEELPYENITSLIGISTNKTSINVSTPDVNKTNSSISPTQRKNEKNTQTEEVSSSTHENKPFVRRRLFRKYRYPSIREQLELQELLASYRTATQTPQPSTSTKNPKVISNRSRYPSIREQLLWSNNVAFGDSRNSLVSEKENPSTPIIEFDDEKGYSSYSDKEEFGKRIRTTERGNSFQTNAGWSSSSLGNGQVNRNLATNISKNSISPHSSQDAEFHPHRSNVNFVPYISSENVRNTNYPQNHEGYLPQKPPSETSRFQYTLPLSPLPYPREKPSYPSQGLPVFNYFNIYNYFNVHNNEPLQNSTETPPMVPQDLSIGDGHSFNHRNRGSVRYTPENLPVVPQGISTGDVYSFNRQNTGSVRYKPDNTLTVSQDLPTGEVHSSDHLNRGPVRYMPENPYIPQREPHKIENPTIIPQDFHHSRGSVRYMSESPSIPRSITSNKENSNVLHNRGTSHYTPERNPVSSQSIPFDSSRHHNHGSVPFSPENPNPSILPQSISNSEVNTFNQNNSGTSYFTAENPSILSHDVPVSAINSFNEHHSGSSSEGNSDLRNRNLNNPPQKRRRKSKKLRILVKKVPNGEGNREDLASRRDEQDKRTRIPKTLLTEIRTNLIRKLAINGKSDVELEFQFQDHVWNIPFVNNQSSVDISPVACTRAGLFQHPKDCNMFYECFWDKWLKRFTLHVFSCPVRLVYDDSIRGCSRPTIESHCRNSI